MSCKLDIKEAILDDINNRFIKDRNTFKIGDSKNKVIVTSGGGSKAQTPSQARAIARNLSDRIAEYTSNHVMGVVNRDSDQDPYIITLMVSNAYIDSEYSKLPLEQQTDPNDPKNPSQEGKKGTTELSISDIGIIEENKKYMSDIDKAMITSNPLEFLKYIAQQSYGISGTDNEVRFEEGIDYKIKPILELAKRMFPESSFINPNNNLPPLFNEC